MAIPKAPVNRIIKDAGAERVSDAKIAKRQTVKADDIALAIDKE